MTIKYVQSLTLYQAGAGNIIGATTVVLTALTDIYGNAITSMTSFGATGYITLEPDTSNEEGAIFTGVTANANGTVSLTGVSTILAQSPYTATSGLVRQHSGGTKVVVTDNVAFWANFANISNLNTFTILPQSAATPTANSDFTTKTYVDNVAISGAPNANTTTKGIVQEATQAQLLAKTASGSTGAELYVNPATMPSTLLSDYKADTGAADASVITPAPAITAYVTGQRFSFKVAGTNTTTTPTLNVNALGAKTIVKRGNAAMIAGDLLIGQIVEVEYDGTNMQLLSSIANTVIPSQTANSGTFLTTNGTVPSWARVNPLVYISGSQISVNTTTAETTLYTVSMPGNLLGTGNAVKIEIPLSLLQWNAGGQTHTLRLKYGVTTLATIVLTGTGTIHNGFITAYLIATGATNAQKGILSMTGVDGSTSSTSNITIGAIGTGTSAIDSTTSQTLTITDQPNTSAALTNITAEGCIITLVI